MRVTRQLAFFRQTMQSEGLSGFQFALKSMMVLVSILLTIFTVSLGSGSTGLLLLKYIAYINSIFVVVAAVNLFCSCITEEKEGGTLGLLLMTGLSPFGLIMGKSISRLYLVMQLLLIQLPLIFLAHTLGGVSSGQIMALLAFCLSFIVFLSQLGLLFSVICRKTSTAVTLTVIIGLIFYILFKSSVYDPILWLEAVFSTKYAGSSGAPPVRGMCACGGLFLILSILLFNPAIRNIAGRSQTLERTESRPRLRFRNHPILEKDLFFMTGGVKALFLKVAAGFLIYLSFDDYVDREWLIYISCLWLWAEGALYSQTLFSREISYGTLESLVMLPISFQKLTFKKLMVFLIAMSPALVFTAVSFADTVNEGWIKFGIVLLVWTSHMLISIICSIALKKMKIIITLLFIVIFTVVYGLCPIFWLFFLPTIVLLTVNITESIRKEVSS